jgi:23S rRNA pseudouridine2605 synthase
MSDETKPEIREGSRIAKVMARAGLCSRRDAEAWIAAGRVSVNGEVLLSPAYNVSDADDVRVDGQRLGAPERTRLFLFHKPRGLVTTARDPEGRFSTPCRQTCLGSWRSAGSTSTPRACCS